MRQRADLAFDRGHGGRHDRQFAHAEAEQNRYGTAVGRSAAANGDEFARRLAGGRGRRDQLQHRRMQCVGTPRELRMAAIHRERVLRQIVAADRQKIDGIAASVAAVSAAAGVSIIAPSSTRSVRRNSPLSSSISVRTAADFRKRR